MKPLCLLLALLPVLATCQTAPVAQRAQGPQGLVYATETDAETGETVTGELDAHASMALRMWRIAGPMFLLGFFSLLASFKLPTLPLWPGLLGMGCAYLLWLSPLLIQEHGRTLFYFALLAGGTAIASWAHNRYLLHRKELGHEALG